MRMLDRVMTAIDHLDAAYRELDRVKASDIPSVPMPGAELDRAKADITNAKTSIETLAEKVAGKQARLEWTTRPQQAPQ